MSTLLSPEYLLMRLRSNLDWLLILTTVPLFATKTLFNWPLLIMALVSLVQITRRQWRLSDIPGGREFAMLFIAFWLPMLLASPDGFNAERAFQTTLSYLRFALAGFFILRVLTDQAKLKRLTIGTGIIVGAWSADGLIQFFFGANLLGYPHERLQVNGIFYPRFLLGIMTVSFLPVVLALCVSDKQRRALWVVTAFVLLLAIVLSSNRTSWFLTLVILLGFAPVLAWHKRSGALKVAAISVIVSCILVSALITSHAPLRDRIIASSQVLTTDAAQLDVATGYRLSLWRTALTMFRQHPVNGIGPRGFRYAYPQFASENDFWMQNFGRGQTHPHSQVLEIAAETGLPGLLGYVFACLCLYRLLRRSCAKRSTISYGWVLAAGLSVFPLNVHKALFSSYWSALVWLLMAIAVAAANPSTGRSRQNRF